MLHIGYPNYKKTFKKKKGITDVFPSIKHKYSAILEFSCSKVAPENKAMPRKLLNVLYVISDGEGIYCFVRGKLRWFAFCLSCYFSR